MKEQIHIDETTLLNYFTDSVSLIEKEKIEKWIRQSEENRKLARDVQHIYLASETLNIIKQTDASIPLKTVKSRIKQHKKISFITKLQRIAAILFIPLLLISTYYWFREEPMEYIEFTTTPGMVTSFDLPDGSKVWLNSGSKLIRPLRFTGKTREVNLIGEAYFSVHKDRDKPFIVNTPFHIKAEVLGTEFNMEAYAADSSVRTTLVSGSVRLSFLSENEQQKSFLMKPNEEFVYNQYSRKTKVDKPFVPTQTAWKDGLVIFKNTSLEDALKILSKRFNVEFIVKNDVLYDNSFTGPFDGQHLQLVLEHFRWSSGIRYKYIDPEKGDKSIREKTIVELY